eukprot:1180988-Prorocentrum_minimum.AAC.2
MKALVSPSPAQQAGALQIGSTKPLWTPSDFPPHPLMTLSGPRGAALQGQLLRGQRVRTFPLEKLAPPALHEPLLDTPVFEETVRLQKHPTPTHVSQKNTNQIKIKSNQILLVWRPKVELGIFPRKLNERVKEIPGNYLGDSGKKIIKNGLKVSISLL